MSEEEKKKIKQAQQIEALRQIRMQSEYQTALAAFQGPGAKEVKDKERERQKKLLAKNKRERRKRCAVWKRRKGKQKK